MVPAQKEFAERAKAARARMAEAARRVELAEREAERVRRIVAEYRATTVQVANPKAVVARIKRECAEKHGVTADQIDGRLRYPGIVRARHEALWRVRNETGMSLHETAWRFRLNHTTVLWGIRQHEARMAGTTISRVKGAPKISLAQRKPEHRPCAHSSAAISTGAAPGFPADPLSTSQDA